MPVYRITVKLFGREKTEVLRYFKEDLDTTYAVLRKRVNVQYGYDNLHIFDLVMLSSHSQEHQNVMHNLQHFKYNQRQQITSIFDLPKLPEGKVKSMYKK